MTEHIEEVVEQEETTFTQADVDRQISKAVESALSKNKAKWEEEKQAELEKAKNEAAEYAKLTQKEKEEAELTKRLGQLEQREKELNQRELLNQIQGDLKEHNLPLELADSLIHTNDSEKIKTQLTAIKQLVDNEVNARVKEALRQDTPGESNGDLSNDPFQAILNKYK